MAKNVTTISFSKATLSKNEINEFIITEISKDSIKDYNLSEILNKMIGIDGLSLNIEIDDQIESIAYE